MRYYKLKTLLKLNKTYNFIIIKNNRKIVDKKNKIMV